MVSYLRASVSEDSLVNKEGMEGFTQVGLFVLGAGIFRKMECKTNSDFGVEVSIKLVSQIV
jgi:hypothetical protein